MSEKYLRGKIVFINNAAETATIEYITNNKIKNIQAVIHEKQQQKTIVRKLTKKSHRFLIGDHVKFIIKKAATGVFFADHVLYEYNNTLEVLINKGRIENKFLGYVKKIDDQYFIKEIESYLFFPLHIYKYENPPTPSVNEKAVPFKLNNIEYAEKLIAELYNHNYQPGFLIAVQQFKKREHAEAHIKKITRYGVFVTLNQSNIESKIPLNKEVEEIIETRKLEIGSSILVKIKHITGDRVIVEII